MSYDPAFTDTALVRMQQFGLQKWQVVRAFESSEKTYKDNDLTVGRTTVDGKLISVTYRKLDNGD